MRISGNDPAADRTAAFERKVMWSIAAAGVLLRIFYLLEFLSMPYSHFAIGPDVMEYDLRAGEILRGVFFPQTPEIHAPLYSWFLAAVYLLGGGRIWFARTIQLILNFLSYWWMTCTLKKTGAPFRLRAWFFALAVLTPVLFFHQAELISESLLAPLTALFLHLTVGCGEKRGRRPAAGAVLGAMVLTHGLMLFFAAAEVIYALFRRRFRETGLLVCGMAAVIVPVVFGKSIYYGRLTGIQSNSAYNLWIGHNPEATGGCYLRPGRMWRAPLNEARAEAERDGISESRVFLRKIGRFYLEHPGKALLLPLKKAGAMIAPWEPISGADPETLIRKTFVQKYGSGGMAAILVLALCGTYFAFREKDGRYAHFYLLAASMAAGLLLTVVSGRYRTGMMPGLLLLAALGAVHLRGREWIVVILCVTPAAVLRLPAPHMGECEAASIEGEAYYRTGDFDRAEKLLKFASYGIDDPARFDNMLGSIAEKRGEYGRAEKRYANALALDPDFPDAWLNLGHLYFFHFPAKGEEALRLIGEALRRDPALPSAYNMLGIHLARQGAAKEAEKMFSKALEYDPGNKMYLEKIEICRRMSAERSKNAPESGNP